MRIEQCGPNLCGYSVDKKSNQNGEQVLIEQEERLDRANVALRILDDKIPVFEILPDRAFDKVVVPVILALTGKGFAPMLQMQQAGTRHNVNCAAGDRGRGGMNICNRF